MGDRLDAQGGLAESGQQGPRAVLPRGGHVLRSQGHLQGRQKLQETHLECVPPLPPFPRTRAEARESTEISPPMSRVFFFSFPSSSSTALSPAAARRRSELDARPQHIPRTAEVPNGDGLRRHGEKMRRWRDGDSAVCDALLLEHEHAHIRVCARRPRGCFFLDTRPTKYARGPRLSPPPLFLPSPRLLNYLLLIISSRLHMILAADLVEGLRQTPARRTSKIGKRKDLILSEEMSRLKTFLKY